jgi:hypothetical protein
MQIEAGAARVELQGRTKQQFCVPAVALDGQSYRLKEAKERAARKAKSRTLAARKAR